MKVSLPSYNRSSNHPVVFFPTAWSDKSNPGMYASETLHFFLKYIPCVVIEPRFDGTTFRLMFSPGASAITLRNIIG
ncbi:hypothetical protein [Bacteroides salyersiae]|uniref:hypothetical protein n=2 Tax=Bacteroides salyersiae TaxID=291644 RepID=UPI00189A8A9F|nr:hypothetical protein [Bacteroides salyersiae]